jgi:hypothetical protein
MRTGLNEDAIFEKDVSMGTSSTNPAVRSALIAFLERPRFDHVVISIGNPRSARLLFIAMRCSSSSLFTSVLQP